MDRSECFLNPDLIERIENKVFTTNIILTTDKTIITKEKADQVVNKILDYRRKIFWCSYPLYYLMAYALYGVLGGVPLLISLLVFGLFN